MLAVVVLDDLGLERYHSDDECTGKRNFLGEAVERFRKLYVALCCWWDFYCSRLFDRFMQVKTTR
jgi:hypothetical protein